MKTVTGKGRTVEEAIQNALEELETTIENVTTKVIEIPDSGIIGGVFGNKYAKVEVTLNDDVQGKACDFLYDVLDVMGLSDAQLYCSVEEDILIIDIECSDTGMLIGRRGQTLDALQYLTSLVANKDREDYTRISLDVADYREKRKDALQDLADRIAQKVQKSRGKYELEPMNPYERRIIHSALQSYKNITTYSNGEEPNRYVIIEYKHE